MSNGENKERSTNLSTKKTKVHSRVAMMVMTDKSAGDCTDVKLAPDLVNSGMALPPITLIKTQNMNTVVRARCMLMSLCPFVSRTSTLIFNNINVNINGISKKLRVLLALITSRENAEITTSHHRLCNKIAIETLILLLM
jgi:hypothetical protein